MPGFLDFLNNVGSNIRYGVSPEEKYKMLVEKQVPGMPEPFTPRGEENPQATRFLSNYLGTKQWGELPSKAFNTGRYLLDDEPDLYAQGIKGQEAGNRDSGANFMDFFR